MTDSPLLAPHFALRAKFCNHALSVESNHALAGRVAACLRTDPGLYVGVVARITEVVSRCPTNHDETHTMRLADLRVAGGRLKLVPVNMLGTWPVDAAPIADAERLLSEAVNNARFNCASSFRLHELVVVPLRSGGFSFALVTVVEEMCVYPCYVQKGQSHVQPIVAVSLLDERGAFRRRRKRLPTLFVGKLSATFEATDVWRNANRVLARMNAPSSTAPPPPPPTENRLKRPAPPQFEPVFEPVRRLAVPTPAVGLLPPPQLQQQHVSHNRQVHFHPQLQSQPRPHPQPPPQRRDPRLQPQQDGPSRGRF
jgi:hypothetical protein